MNREDIIRMAREAGLAHFYDSEGHCSGITDARLITENKDRNDDRLIEMLAPFAALVAAAEREALEKIDWTVLLRQGALVTWGDAATLADRVIAAIRARGQE